MIIPVPGLKRLKGTRCGKEHLVPANSAPCLLMEAARNGQESVVATLLATGIDPNSYGETDWMALHHAAAYGHANVVKLLLDAGADLDITTDREKNHCT